MNSYAKLQKKAFTPFGDVQQPNVCFARCRCRRGMCRGEYQRRGCLNSKPLKHERCGGAPKVKVEEKDEWREEESRRRRSRLQSAV